MDNFFAPSNITISQGQPVQWTNMGSPHTVTSNPGTLGCSPTSTEAFDSGTLPGGGIFTHTFTTPGTFAYHCEVHGCTMAGTVTVT
jgi:plastocyanin